MLVRIKLAAILWALVATLTLFAAGPSAAHCGHPAASTTAPLQPQLEHATEQPAPALYAVAAKLLVQADTAPTSGDLVRSRHPADLWATPQSSAHPPAASFPCTQPDQCERLCAAHCAVADLALPAATAFRVAVATIRLFDDRDPETTDREPATPPPRA